MKKLFTLLFPFFCFFAAFGQGLITDPSVALKPGMYKTFQEFKSNNPSLPLPENYKIESYERPYGTAFGGKNHLDYMLLINNKRVKEKTPVYGFCDGSKIYINPFNGDISRKGGSFDQLTSVGRYCTYRSIKSEKGKPEVVRGGVTEGGSNKLNTHIIDLKTGLVTKLTKKNLKNIISADAELTAAFKADNDSEDKLEEYLIMYSGKHREELNQ